MGRDTYVRTYVGVRRGDGVIARCLGGVGLTKSRCSKLVYVVGGVVPVSVEELHIDRVPCLRLRSDVVRVMHPIRTYVTRCHCHSTCTYMFPLNNSGISETTGSPHSMLSARKRPEC